MSRERGLTLIETVVAMTVIATVAALCAQSLAASIKADMTSSVELAEHADDAWLLSQSLNDYCKIERATGQSRFLRCSRTDPVNLRIFSLGE